VFSLSDEKPVGTDSVLRGLRRGDVRLAGKREASHHHVLHSEDKGKQGETLFLRLERDWFRVIKSQFRTPVRPDLLGVASIENFLLRGKGEEKELGV